MNIPQHNQSQSSLVSQLSVLQIAAVRLGLYDAADFISFNQKERTHKYNELPEDPILDALKRRRKEHDKFMAGVTKELDELINALPNAKDDMIPRRSL